MGVDKRVSDVSADNSICPGHGLLPKALILLHFPFHPSVMNSIHHYMDVSVAAHKEKEKNRKDKDNRRTNDCLSPLQ